MTRPATRLWLCLAVATSVCATSACATQSVTLEPGPRTFTSRDYDEVYERWTRDLTSFSFSRMSDVLHATATFESWEFRWAYVIRYAQDHGLDADARTAMLRATLQDASEHHRFLITLAAENFADSDLTATRAGWRVLLVDSHGRSIPASRVDAIRRPGPAEQHYFRSISRFRMAFRVVFPVAFPDGTPTIPRDTPYFLLRFTGAAGTRDVRWSTAADN